MRRFIVGVALLAMTATPLTAWGGDSEIAKHIMSSLKKQRDAGALKGFKLDMKIEDGVVVFDGTVANDMQRKAVLSTAKDVAGIRQVVNKITVRPTQAMTPIATATKPKLLASANQPRSKKPVTIATTPIGAPAPKMIERPIQHKKVVAARPAPRRPISTEGLMGENDDFMAKSPAPLQRTVAQPVALAAATEAVRPSSSDAAVTKRVAAALNKAKQTGRLRGFGADVSTENGDVWLKGHVTTNQQKAVLIDIVRRIPGVRQVVDDVDVKMASPIRQAKGSDAQSVPAVQPVGTGTRGNGQLEVARSAPVQLAPYRSQDGMPRPFAPASSVVSGSYGGGAVSGMPMSGMPAPAYPTGANYGGPSYEQPNLPNYAWPGYAAAPNYAALSYPKQYSPTAWPYIGPFYPYPQVPLGWRKVTLEWDDGWWMLDFTAKSR